MESMVSKIDRIFGSDKAIIFTLILLSVIPRLCLLCYYSSYSGDGVSYLSTSIYLKNPDLIGEVPKRIYFILYPSLVLLVDFIFNNIALSGRVLNLLIGTAIPPMIYLLGRRFLTRKTAFFAAVLCVFNPILLEQSVTIRGDNLFALLTLITIFVFESCDWSKPKVRDALYLALILGLAQLSRTNGLMYLLVIIPIWLMWIRAGKIPIKEWLLKTLIPFLLLFFVIFMIPHAFLAIRGEKLPSMFVYTYLDGNIAATSDREEVFFKLNSDATEYQFLEDVAQTEMRELITDLSILPAKYIRNFKYCLQLLFYPIIDVMVKMSIFLLPLVFYVFFYSGEIKIPPGLKRTVFWAWPSFFLLPAINIENLYFLPLIPVLMLVLVWIFDTASGLGWISKWKNWIFIFLILIVLIPECLQSSQLMIKEKNYINPYIPAGEWINENSDMETKIMARNPEVFFHAFRHGYRMPYEDLDRTLKFSLYKGVTYMVFGPTEQERRKELFLSLYEEIFKMGDKSRIELVETIDTGQDRVFILKLVPENI